MPVQKNVLAKLRIILSGAGIQIYGLYKAQQTLAYIDWNHQKIEYILPGKKKRVTIQISELTAIEIKVFQVIFYFKNGNKTILNMENFLYKDLQTIKEGMQAIGKSLENQKKSQTASKD